jgi:hypothetical protein
MGHYRQEGYYCSSIPFAESPLSPYRLILARFTTVVPISMVFRTWVIQDQALGKKSEVLLGSKLLSLGFFALATFGAIASTQI